MKLFCFRRNYFIWTLILLVIEIVIAVFIRDQFIRPHGGDVLVVLLVYCFLRTFFCISIIGAALAALAIAFAAEVGQYFHLIRFLRIENNPVASAFFGNSFDASDLLAYTVGVILILLIEYVIKNKLQHRSGNPDRT